MHPIYTLDATCKRPASFH
uniref:Uncharacterized protein n=1 Tax=Lepeophtheirus salmonis TaxID=72036 RepID=A0A0K2UMV5_LEPSM